VTTLAALKCLQVIDGGLSITNTDLETLSGLGNLTFTGNEAYYYNAPIYIVGNDRLSDAELPALLMLGALYNQQTYQRVVVSQNPVLETVAMDALDGARIEV